MFTSELVAISKGLCIIEVSNATRHVILSDSLSSLLALRTFIPCNPLVQDILTRLRSLDRAGTSVQFCWIPSHVAIRGNEIVDAAARRAASVPCIRRLLHPARNLYPAVKSLALPQWRKERNTERGKKLREPRHTLGPLTSSSRGKRHEEVTLCRLRLGHMYATHGYLLRGEERPGCPRCSLPLTSISCC